MSREKQIEDMAILVIGFCQTIEYGGSCEKCAKCDEYKMTEALYNAGYRKASDVAREIFTEIEKCFFEELVGCAEAKLIDEEMFAELKKKYTESEGEG